MPLSIRFKRKHTTVFLFCDPAEKFEAIKARLCPLFGVASPAELRLVAEDKTTVFGSEAMISDFPLTDESLCYVTFGPEEAPGE